MWDHLRAQQVRNGWLCTCTMTCSRPTARMVGPRCVCHIILCHMSHHLMSYGLPRGWLVPGVYVTSSYVICHIILCHTAYREDGWSQVCMRACVSVCLCVCACACAYTMYFVHVCVHTYLPLVPACPRGVPLSNLMHHRTHFSWSVTGTCCTGVWVARLIYVRGSGMPMVVGLSCHSSSSRSLLP